MDAEKARREEEERTKREADAAQKSRKEEERTRREKEAERTRLEAAKRETDAKAKATVLLSSFSCFFFPFLALKIMLEPLINSFNSRGSIEALTSGPFVFFESMKCFSIIQAPSAIAPNDE